MGFPVAPDIGGDYVRPWKRSRRRSMVRSPPRRAWQDWRRLAEKAVRDAVASAPGSGRSF